MKAIPKFTLILVLVCLSFLTTSCQQDSSDTGDKPSAIANPASVYCVELGYQLEIRQTDAGEEGVCIFPEGVECPEWDFLAGRCGQEYSFCHQNSGVLVDNGTNVGTCVFRDESTCDEYEFSQGKCRAGQNPAEDK